jgi:hypothetical protein
MATTEERMRVLRMIQEGKVTPEEGIHLIEALEHNSRRAAARPTAADPPQPPSAQGTRWLRVRVTDTDTGRVRVNVRLPVGVITAGVKMGAKFSPEVDGVNMAQILEYVRAGETGKVADVYDDEDGEHVEVFIE